MPGRHLTKRLIWIVPAATLVGLSLAVPTPAAPPSDAALQPAAYSGGPAASGPAPSASPGSADPASGTAVAARAGDRLAQAFLTLEALGGFALTAEVTESYAGKAAPTAHLDLVYDARGEGGPVIAARGEALVSDTDSKPTEARIYVAGGTMAYDNGSGWEKLPYSGPASIFAAFGLYDEWDWLREAYAAGAVTMDVEAGSGTYRVSIDPSWLSQRVAEEQLAVVPVSATYTVQVRDAVDGPVLDVTGHAEFRLDGEPVQTDSHLIVRSVAGLDPITPPADLVPQDPASVGF
ncbi:MAG: hypothetical protein IMW98_06825 [Firmicutes bacterium]|nr:hypothetical protein [Bacillota bacterium]